MNRERFFISESPSKEDKSGQILDKSSKEKKDTHFIESVYKRGRIAIWSLLATIGIAKYNNAVENQSIQDLKGMFKNIPKSQEHEINSVLHTLFTKDELKRVVEIEQLSNSANLSQVFLDQKAQEALLELHKSFKVVPRVLWDADMAEQDKNHLIESLENPKYKKIIQDIRSHFPADYQPTAEFLPLGAMGRLDDPKYVEGLKLLAELKVEGYYNPPFPHGKQISNFTKDSKAYSALSKIRALGGRIHFNIFYLLGEGDDKDTLKTNKLVTFLEKNKNKEAIEYSSDVSLGQSLRILMSDSTGYWSDFFSKKENQENIEYLKSLGYNFDSFLSMDKKYTHYINNNNFIEFARVLSEKISPSYLQEGFVGDIFDQVSSYYDFKNSNDNEKLENDLEQFTQLNSADLVDALSHKKEIALNIFNSLSTESSTTEEQSKGFFKDPALKLVEHLHYTTPDAFPEFLKNMTTRDQAEWIMRVCRNMYVQELEPTPENFKKVYLESVNMRLNLDIVNKDLFTNRNVAFFAHNEIWDKTEGNATKGEKRFGRDSSITGIKTQHPLELLVFQAKNTKESLKETKNRFLEYISSHDKLTILVDAHGSEYGFFLTSGILNKDGTVLVEDQDYYISVGDMAQALEKRFDNGHTDIPIFLESACFNQNFIRNLYAVIMESNTRKNKHTSLPIACGVSEYGQYGYTDNKVYGNVFMKVITSSTHSAKIKDLILLEAGIPERTLSNISLFVPLENKEAIGKDTITSKDIYYQIARNNPKNRQRIFEAQYARELEAGVFNGTTASYFEAAQKERAKEIQQDMESKLIKKELPS